MSSLGTRGVIGLGSVVVDQQMFVDSMPVENQKEHATTFRQQIGGPVPTALAVARRYGLPCGFLGPWGDDAGGLAIEADFRNIGVSASDSCCIPGQHSGLAHVWTSNGTGARTIVANQCDWAKFRLSASDRASLAKCRLLHLDGTGGDVAIEAASLTKENGGLVFVDAGSPKEATADLIPLADVFSFPERFAEQFFASDDVQAAGREIQKLGAAAAICTQGEDGAILFEADRIARVPAFPVDVVDSTGAGDVFCGGVIAAILEGQCLEEAVRVGAATAALKCAKVGNRDAIPTREEVAQLLNDS